MGAIGRRRQPERGKMTASADPDPMSSLLNFFIFDSSRHVSENEEYKNIAYFHPLDTPLDIQMKQVGRAAAILKFTQTFSPSETCHFLHSKNTQQYFHEPEPGFVMVMTVQAPDSQPVNQPSKVVNDKVYHSLLCHSYKMFRLFMGTFRPQLAFPCNSDTSFDELKIRTNYFFSKVGT